MHRSIEYNTEHDTVVTGFVASARAFTEWRKYYSLFQNSCQTFFLRILSKLLDRSAPLINQIVEKKIP